MESFYRRRLPHYRNDADGTVYFLTWRLASDQHPLTAHERDQVLAALRFWHGHRCRLLAAVVMDDHVHLLVSPFAGASPEGLLHSWKTFTGRRLVLGGRRAPVWQHESYDRIVRNEAELAELTEYIACNPSKRWPDVGEYRWFWCPAMEADPASQPARV